MKPTMKPRTEWKKRSYTTDPLYKDSVEVNVENGLPANYHSLYLVYRKLAHDIAIQHGIPPQDREDAVQEVDLKFFAKDGLNWYDPNRTYETNTGSTRNIKFGSMYQSWLFLSMMAERDKYRKRVTRSIVVDKDTLPEDHEPDILIDIEERDVVTRWIEVATKALEEEGRSDLIPVLKVCAAAAALNKTVTRADVVAASACPLRLATSMLIQLREVLSAVGLKEESCNVV